jgi:hypothetical protein
MEISTLQINKEDVDRFLACKHVTGCSICARSRRDVELWTIKCEPRPSTKYSVNIIFVVCENCGAAQLYSHEVIARWLEQRNNSWGPKVGISEAGGRKTSARNRMVYSHNNPLAALAAVFLFVLMACLLLHRYGITEVWTRPTIATVDDDTRV